MTEPSTGAGGTAVGITAGPVGTGEDEAMWYRGCETCSETGKAWQGGEEFGECEVCSGRGFVWVALDDILTGIHPALPAVAAWLAANPDAVETLRDLAYIVGMAAEVCGWKGAHVPSPLRIAVGERFTDARYRQLRSLVAALTTDGGA